MSPIRAMINPIQKLQMKITITPTMRRIPPTVSLGIDVQAWPFLSFLSGGRGRGWSRPRRNLD